MKIKIIYKCYLDLEKNITIKIFSSICIDETITNLFIVFISLKLLKV